MFYILVLILTIAALVYTYRAIWKVDKQHKADIASKLREIEIAEADVRQQRQEVLTRIEEFYGRSVAEQVERGGIWQQMPDHLLKASLGWPEEIKEAVYKDKRVEDYFYNSYINRLGNVKYTLQVTVENGVVVGWKDMN